MNHHLLPLWASITESEPDPSAFVTGLFFTLKGEGKKEKGDPSVVPGRPSVSSLSLSHEQAVHMWENLRCGLDL